MSVNTEDSETTFYSAIISNKKLDEVLKDDGWDLSIGGGYPGVLTKYYGNGKRKRNYYSRYSSDEIEPLVIYRNFQAGKKSYFEISEEFRLFHKLYHNKNNNTYIKIYDDGNEEEIIKIVDQTENGVYKIDIKLKQILEYITIKDMSLLSFFEVLRFIQGDIGKIPEQERDYTEVRSDLRYRIYIADDDVLFKDKFNIFSRLLGKKIIKGFNKKFDMYDSEKNTYEEFIIGIDEKGNDIHHTSNPDLLSNHFGKNKGAPHFLKPVFFDRNVLKKYYTNPERYTVSDGQLYCEGLWFLRIDNSHRKYVIVALGDLGSLSDREQKYWKSFNVKPDGHVSKTYFERMIKGNFAEPEQEDLIFKLNFNRFNEKWGKKFGWTLFKHLNEDDSHYFKTLRIPLVDDQSEFDEQILSLSKILVDSINEKELESKIHKAEDEKGIKKLKKFLESEKIENFSQHTDFLVDLYALRSSGIGHRKGDNYKKIAKKFGIGEKDLREVMREILINSNKFIEFMDKQFIK